MMPLPLLPLLLATARAPPAAAQEVFNVLEYGANGDGATSDTVAIRAAAAALEAAGGGTLLFPARRRYLTGAFNLSSHTVLRLEANAVIHGSGISSEYPLLTLFEIWPWFGPTRQLPGCGGAATRFMHQPFVFAWRQRNISIVVDEGGTLDGNGWPWWSELALSFLDRLSVLPVPLPNQSRADLHL